MVPMGGSIYGTVWCNNVRYSGVTVTVRKHKDKCKEYPGCSPDGGGGTTVGQPIQTDANGNYYIPVPTPADFDVQARLGPYHKTNCDVHVNDNDWVRVDFTCPFCVDHGFT